MGYSQSANRTVEVGLNRRLSVEVIFITLYWPLLSLRFLGHFKAKILNIKDFYFFPFYKDCNISV